MKVFIANFGRANQLWPACLENSTIAIYEDENLWLLRAAGDRDAYIARCISTKRSTSGTVATKALAARWFNQTAVISSTADNDLWVHRAKNELWWTTPLPGESATTLEVDVSYTPGQRAYVMRKGVAPWSNRNKQGNRLLWSALHPRAREFLFAEGTLQQLSNEYAAYTVALIEGHDLGRWHDLPMWKAKAKRAGKGAVTVFNPRQAAVIRMALSVRDTVAGAHGQKVERRVKRKESRFVSQQELERYINARIDLQNGLCALTELPLQFDEEHDDKQLLCSLDRIDSNGHYEPGNLQVVCQFANRWKSDADDGEFRRLLHLVREQLSSSGPLI